MVSEEPSSSSRVHEYATQTPSKDPSKARLDHIIILLPHNDLINLPEWLTSHFTVSPGGRHADGKTENKLILFFDGSYVELIAFINDDPKNKQGHWWGEKEVGIIDYAFTTDGDAKAHWERVQARLARLDPSLRHKYGYDQPVTGGRRRDDGVDLKWEVTFPTGVSRGELPFFCHDLTPRAHRVPFSREACTHPSNVYGLEQLVVYVPEDKAAEVSAVYAAILDQDNLDTSGDGTGTFAIETVRTVDRVQLPRVHIQRPSGQDQKKRVEEQGVLLGDLVFGSVSTSSSAVHPVRLDTEQDYGNISLQL